MPREIENMSETTDDPLSALLRRLRFGAEVFVRARYCGDWAVDTSGSRRVPFHLVSAGEGWLHLPDGPPEALAAGELVLFPQDGPHVLAASPERPAAEVINRPPPALIADYATTLVCGHFDFDARAAGPLLEGLPPVLRLSLGEVDSDGGTDALVRLWMQEAGSDAPGSALAVDLLAEVVFLHALRAAVQRGELCGVAGALADPRLGPVLAGIHAAPGAAHTIEQMSALAGLSTTAFAARFRERIGMTPARYVKHWRMQAAAEAVQHTEASMAAIAEDVGYGSEVAFRKAFSEFFGVPPGQMRRAERR